MSNCDKAYASYGCVALKRTWVPEWLYALVGQAVLKQPLRWILTKKVSA